MGKFLGINAPNVFRNGFRLVVFSIIIKIVVLFFLYPLSLPISKRSGI